MPECDGVAGSSVGGSGGGGVVKQVCDVCIGICQVHTICLESGFGSTQSTYRQRGQRQKNIGKLSAVKSDTVSMISDQKYIVCMCVCVSAYLCVCVCAYAYMCMP